MRYSIELSLKELKALKNCINFKYNSILKDSSSKIDKEECLNILSVAGKIDNIIPIAEKL